MGENNLIYEKTFFKERLQILFAILAVFAQVKKYMQVPQYLLQCEFS